MFRWIPYTFIRIALCFIAGIVLGIHVPEIIPERVAIVMFGVLTVLYVFFYIFFRGKKRTYFNLGILGLPAIFFAGYAHLLGQTESRNPQHVTSISGNIEHYEAVVSRYAEEKARSWKVEARVRAVHADSWEPHTGKIILYLAKDDFTEPFGYGDVLLVKGAPQEAAPPANPGEFDYRKFLAYRNISHQHFLRAGDVKLIGNEPASTLMSYAIRARLWGDETLKKYVRGAREQAIASALVLGVTDGLDNELMSAYAATGAMHVLAVSGLHVSIIYMIILWPMKSLQRSRSGRWVVAITALFMLWSYAFITGLSPSVLRAVTMFSFIAVARPTGQSTNIYNTLAASAFCLLIFDPYLIMSVGFQLSYLAVVGIVYLAPRLYRFWEPRHWLMERVWAISTVAVAAQIATFALGLFYFHQFPNYFLLSNLAVIPIAFAVLLLGIAVLAASIFPVIAGTLGLVLTGCIWGLNEVVFAMESFPYSVTKGVYISAAQCWLLMGMVVAFILLFEQKRFHYLTSAFILAAVFAVLQWIHLRDKVDVSRITVYHVRGHSAIDLIDRGHAWFLADSTLQSDDQRIGFHIQPNRMIAGIASVEAGDRIFSRRVGGCRIILWKNKTIVQVNSRGHVFPGRLRADLIVVSNNAVKNFRHFAAKHAGTPIILDSSNSVGYSRVFMETARDVQGEVHAVLLEGAFDWKLAT